MQPIFNPLSLHSPLLTLMSNMTFIILWCHIKGNNTVFPITTSSTTFIGILKNKIKKEKSNYFQGVDASDLVLWKVHLIDTIVIMNNL